MQLVFIMKSELKNCDVETQTKLCDVMKEHGIALEKLGQGVEHSVSVPVLKAAIFNTKE